MIDLSKYVLETLWRDHEFSLSRGSNPENGSRVLVLSPLGEYTPPQTLGRLDHEYAFREELDPTWAAQPIAMVSHWDRTVLVSSDPGGEPLTRLLAQPIDLETSLQLAIGLSQAIGHLHQQGVVHKDIKPANVLADLVTGQCWLRGFGIASRLQRERQLPEPPELVEGTLAYMAPEQTGRMNRSIDSRSDLYSFGITLYEMLTGALPFTASEPMEWIHCQIAREPVPPGERSNNVPAPVSAIIMKLLAKTAEERYQTAAGVERDLRHCLAEWETRGRIDEFELGLHDTPDRLLIPEKLYGREREFATLLASFNRVVASGKPEFILVSGYSGIGKSSVVNELHKELVPPRGLFAAGKFDQHKRDIPYATLAQALRSLVLPLLSKNEAELQRWRESFRDALGPNGQLILDLVPDLERITGQQPAVPDLSPQDAQARFQAVFRRFISVFARQEHPLALFLDDLQWLDAATLDLIEDLLTGSDVEYLMLIGAYRDNEVDSAHPLIRKLDAIRRVGATVEEVILAPLSREDLGCLIADSLHGESEQVASLAQLVHDKTAGNAFFAVQFISALAEEELVTFDYGAGRWSWDLNRIQAKGYTANVVDLMVKKLNRLPNETRTALQGLACLGIRSDIATLSIVNASSEKKIRSDLWEAVRLEFVIASEDAYKFIHDRVQEAAYSLIPEELRAEAHLRIGRLLAKYTPGEKREESLFEIVNQLNRGSELIDSREEREWLAQNNLAAGQRAKTSTAFASALAYFAAGRAVLPEESWEDLYELTFALEFQQAECEFLTGDFPAAEERLSTLSRRAKDLAESAAVACLQIELHTALDQIDRAVELGLELLRRAGISLPLHPTEDEWHQEVYRIWQQLGSRQIEALVDLPRTADPASRAILDVLTALEEPAHYIDKNLQCLAITQTVNLSLEKGNSDGSCVAYGQLGWLVIARFADYQTGFQFGKLSLDLVEKHGLERFRTRVTQRFGYFLNPWARHFRSSVELMRRSFDTALEAGDVKYAVYACDRLITLLLAAGDPLSDVEREAQNGLAFVRKAKFGFIADIITANLRFLRSLRGMTESLSCFSEPDFDETGFEQYLEANPQPPFAAGWYWIRKQQAHFYAGNYALAIAAGERAEPLRQKDPGHPESPEYWFYDALARAGEFDSASPDQKREHREVIAAHLKEMAILAENCPQNFGNRSALMAAELARIEERDFDAMHGYEEAIHSSRESSFIQNEAIAHEAAARFYAARGFKTIAEAYMRNARRCYLRWGALAKVQLIDRHHPPEYEEGTPSSAATIETRVEQLDLGTVMKAAQAVSSEIVLGKLIDTLMRTAIEHAGAQRGVLILMEGDEPRFAAEATTSGDTIVVRSEELHAGEISIPESVLQYVVRSEQIVLLEDASAQNLFTETYFRERHARSILCLPLIHQTKLIGALYLENNLAARVFTPGRIGVLKLLASQAAISLENSRLYADLETREAKIRRLVEANIVGIFIWNLAGEIIEANDAFLQMIGYDRGDLEAGRLRWKELLPQEWPKAGEFGTERADATKTVQAFETEYVQKNGRRVPVLISAAIFEGSGEEGVAFVLDLSEQKRAEAELQQAQTELAHITRVTTLGQMTASIAHEISQPLAAIVTNAKASLRWLGGEAPNLGEANESIRRIVRDGNRAADVIGRMRALFKRDSTTKELFSINEAIEEIVALAQSEVQRNRVVLQTQLASDLPLVFGDKVQLQQVLLNLLSNAIEAMVGVEESSRELQITSRRIGETSAEPAAGRLERNVAGAAAERVLVAVCDSGQGLDAKSLDRLFEPFYTTKSQGLGMGLAISRSIIEAHGGRLWATINAGRGAVFQFTLPIAPDRESL